MADTRVAAGGATPHITAELMPLLGCEVDVRIVRPEVGVLSHQSGVLERIATYPEIHADLIFVQLAPSGSTRISVTDVTEIRSWSFPAAGRDYVTVALHLKGELTILVEESLPIEVHPATWLVEQGEITFAGGTFPWMRPS